MMIHIRNTAIIVVAALIISSLYNGFSGRGIPWFPQKVEVKGAGGIARPQLIVTAAPMKYIEVAEAKVKFDQGVAFIDAREAHEYKAGHVRGATHLSAAVSADEIETALRGIPKEREIVIYCDGEECGASTTLANKLQGLGYTNLQIFFGGWTEWNKAGFPTSRGESRES